MNPQPAVAAALLAGTAFGAAALYTGGADPHLLFASLLATLLLDMAGLHHYWTHARTLALETAPTTVPAGLITVGLLLFAILALGMTPFSILPGTSFVIGWTVATLPLAYFTTAFALRAPASWSASLWAVHAVSVPIVLLGLVDFLLVRSRPFSVFEDVNVLAAFCNLLTLPAIARLQALRATGGWPAALRSGTAAFLLLSIPCLAATASRGGHLSFLFGIVVLGALLIRHDRQAWKTIAVCLLVFAASLAAIAPFQNHAGSLSRLAGMNDQSTADRLAMLRSTWQMVEDGPWYGSGLGTYKIRYLIYRSPDELSTTGDLAHNDYLQMLAEGGPLLLGSLLLIAIGVALAIRRLWRSAPGDTSSTFIEAAGLTGALCCLFAHAALNFIFYVMPLAMLAGLYLGRLEVLRDDIRTFDPFRYLSPAMIAASMTGLMLWLTATLGLQSAYYAMTTGRCDLRLCQQLSGDEKFYGRFSALLAATQPSYLPPREWFVNAYTATANAATDDAKRITAARQAATELSDLIHQYPALPYVYADLGGLLLRHPEAASAVAHGVPVDPTALFVEAVRRNPLDAGTRTRLAQRLEAEGKADAAFALLFDDGMRWWKVAAFPDSGRSMLLKAAIPLALKLGHCKDAIEMAQGLTIFLPDDPLAKPIAKLGEREPPISDGTLSCGAG